MIDNKFEIEQAVRKSHCAHPFSETHACVGVCKITPKGVELDCTICGDGTDEIWHKPEFIKLKGALQVIGINALTLTEYAVKEMIQILNGKKS